MSLSEHQFGEMKSRLDTQGGFTYDPRKRSFVTSGFAVAAHPGAELKEPHSEGGATEGHIKGFVKGSQPMWSQQKGQGRGQEMIGGWRDEEGGKDVLDLPKVFPNTPHGHQKSRQAQVLRNQEASFSLHDMAEDRNPWFTGSSTTPAAHMASGQFPEFTNLLFKDRHGALDPEKYPETASWSEQPIREAGYRRQAEDAAKVKARRG
jgi:hypothetical protein